MEDRIREHREANGIAVIVTNDYTTCPGLDNLPGANIDGQNLTAAFKTLKFDVRSSQNIDKARLYHIVHEISTLDYQSYPRIIFIFAGHGCEGGMLYMQDGTKVMLWETIVEPLLPKNAKNIATIPKAFLFDACRGLETTKTVLVPRSSEVKKTLPRGGDVIDMTKVPEDANFLLAYSTMPNHKAYERKDKGGIWFSTLVDLIQKQVRLYSLDDLLTEVNKSMAANMKGLDFQQPEKFSRLHEVLCLDPRASVPGNPSSVNPPRRIAAVFPSGIHNTAQQPGSTTIPFVQLLARYTKQYGLHEEYIDKEIYNEEYQHVYYSSGVRIVGGHGEILLENHGTNMYVSLDSAREEAAKIAYQSLLEQPPTGQNVLPSSSNERSEARTDGQSVRQLDTSKSLAPEPFKNSRDRLNHYFQKNGLNPRYDYVEDYSSGQQPIFKCTIQYSVNGKIIRRDSGRFFPRKADAKENAARNVLQNMEADTQPCGGSGGAGATVGVSWKSLLKEHYDKRGHPNMVLNYDTMQNGSGFLSKVFVPELRGKVKAEARKKLNRVQQKKLPNMVGYKL